MKTCTRCKESKSFDHFTKDKNSKDGHAKYCRPCRKEMKRKYYLRNKDKVLTKCKEYRKANPEKVAATKRRCYEAKKDEYLAKSKKRYAENKEEILAKCAEYRAKNKDEIRARDNAYKRANRKELSRKQVEYQRRIADRINEYSRNYARERRKRDKLYALRTNIRARFRFELAKRGETKQIKANKYLGCSWLELRKHLESQFTNGMTWDNYGEWHVDHIVPLAVAKDRQQLIELCHYTNLKPLWAFDNISKGAKLPAEIPEQVAHIVEQNIA